MVFQDYELIHTKRVNRVRHSTDVYYKRVFNALGGWNTAFFAASFGAAGYQLRSIRRKREYNHVYSFGSSCILVGGGPHTRWVRCGRQCLR